MPSTNPSYRSEGRLVDYTSGRDNNFTLLRFLAATAVLVSHSFILSTGRLDSEPLRDSLGLSFGPIAVHIFFVASGFLVTGSLLYRQSLRDFITARFLRIYPGLWTALFLTVLVVGLAFTTLSSASYLHHPETWEYILRNATLLIHPAHTLPGAFSDVPYKEAVNGSLWTLPKEVKMYAALAALWLLGKLTRINVVRFLSVACITLALSGMAYDMVLFLWDKTDDVITLLAVMFFMGASLRVLQERVPVSRTLALSLFGALVIAAVLDRTVFGVVYRFTIPYLVIYFAFVPGGFIRRFNALGDYSYGIYIYAFPVQQAVAHFWRGVSPYEMMATSFVITLILAVASWHLVESRALAWKDRLMGKKIPASQAVNAVGAVKITQ